MAFRLSLAACVALAGASLALTASAARVTLGGHNGRIVDQQKVGDHYQLVTSGRTAAIRSS